MQIQRIMRIGITTIMVSNFLDFLHRNTAVLTSKPGNGRRLCPGIHLADRNLFHCISKMLWAFHIEVGSDPETGRPVVPDTDIVTGYREGLTACAYDFPIKLTIRSEARRQAIMKEFAEAKTSVFSRFENGDYL
jgi:cytochrome P450 family 619